MESLKTTLDMTGTCVYSLDEIIEWCIDEYGPIGHIWNCKELETNRLHFEFATSRDLVRFGLTWNTATLKFRPRKYV